MQTVKYLKPHDGAKTGDILQVPNNHAHFLIEHGIASIVQFVDTSNRMVGSKKSNMTIKNK
jgi:hypothetical protein